MIQNPHTKDQILSLARKAIESFFETNNEQRAIAAIMPPKEKIFLEKGASHVALTLDGRPRGFMGSMEAYQPLWEDIAFNAIHAAFYDPHFLPLEKKEYENTRLSVSIVSEPQPLEFHSPRELLTMLSPGEDGVILRNGDRKAASSPRAWRDLPETTEFLAHICVRAGMNADCWQDPKTEIFTYQLETFEE